MSLSPTAMHHPLPSQSYPTNTTTSHQVHENERTILDDEGSGQADEDDASMAAEGQIRLAPPSEHSEPKVDVPFPAEDFKRKLNVIATDRNGNEHLVPAVGLYDSGSESINIISSQLARRLNIEPETPSCPPRGLSRISSKLKIGKGKAIEDVRGVDGARVRHQQSPVFVQWQCLDSSPRLHQHLFFDPKTYRTKHIVVENAAADLIFSRRTWLEEKLTEPSVCTVGRMIGERPKASTGCANRSRRKGKGDEEAERRNGKKGQEPGAPTEKRAVHKQRQSRWIFSYTLTLSLMRQVFRNHFVRILRDVSPLFKDLSKNRRQRLPSTVDKWLRN
ncbi:hypothetical protein IWX90DRAFT_73239 [Phyllosticta citrichinensis]|uniref:Uncharacterized protein n=1 Tax=Phyllosticta citrichinensis TaxID=1130410 RepID=A0ABR1XGQ1_9PEZI